MESRVLDFIKKILVPAFKSGLAMLLFLLVVFVMIMVVVLPVGWAVQNHFTAVPFFSVFAAAVFVNWVIFKIVVQILKDSPSDWI